jgi:hypothetical protein
LTDVFITRKSFEKIIVNGIHPVRTSVPGWLPSDSPGDNGGIPDRWEGY